MPVPHQSIAFRVKRYLSRRPAIRECLLSGLINYSALSRMICRSESITGFDAVVVACRRYRSRARGFVRTRKTLQEMLTNCHASVVNQVAVAVVDKPVDYKKLAELGQSLKAARAEFNSIEGREVLTIIHSERVSALLRKHLGARLRRIVGGLAQINLVFDERFETTPGVVAYIYGLLAQENINIREEMSCGTDLLIVLAQSDVQRALDVLSIFQ